MYSVYIYICCKIDNYLSLVTLSFFFKAFTCNCNTENVKTLICFKVSKEIIFSFGCFAMFSSTQKPEPQSLSLNIFRSHKNKREIPISDIYTKWTQMYKLCNFLKKKKKFPQKLTQWSIHVVINKHGKIWINYGNYLLPHKAITWLRIVYWVLNTA